MTWLLCLFLHMMHVKAIFTLELSLDVNESCLRNLKLPRRSLPELWNWSKIVLEIARNGKTNMFDVIQHFSSLAPPNLGSVSQTTGRKNCQAMLCVSMPQKSVESLVNTHTN